MPLERLKWLLVLSCCGVEGACVSRLGYDIARPSEGPLLLATLDGARSHAFPSLARGSSARASLVATNRGSFSVTLGTVSTAGLGLAAPFHFAGGTCLSEGSVPPKESCSIDIVFRPIEGGLRSANVVLGYAYEGEQMTATSRVTGTGLPPPTCADLGSDLSYDALGSGTAADPYLICDPIQFLDIGGNRAAWGSDFRLGADLDLTGYNASSVPPLVPIGDDAQAFVGTFDGGGHTISNVSFNAPWPFAGLFGRARGGQVVIRSLHLRNVDIGNGMGPTGALIGRLELGTVMDCSATGLVSGFFTVGGLVGEVVTAVVSTSWTDTVVSGTASVGGLVGMLGTIEQGGFVFNSFARADVNGAISAGGLIGAMGGYSYVLSSFATGEVSGDESIGGLVGTSQTSDVVRGCFALGAVNGNDPNESVGHLIGCPNGTFDCVSPHTSVAQSYSAADVPCSNAAGDCHPTLSGEINVATTDVLLEPTQPPLNLFDYEHLWVAGAPLPTLSVVFGDDDPEICAAPASTLPFAGGHGSPESPFLLCSVEHLQALAENPLYWSGRAFRLLAHLDLTARTMTSFPIGSSTQPIAAIFDGMGHTIHGLSLDGGGNGPLGLFGELRGHVRRLALTGVNLVNGHGGAFAADLKGALSDSYATGTIQGDVVGGLAGYARTISHSYSTVTIEASSVAGGLTISTAPVIETSFAAADVVTTAGGPLAAGSANFDDAYYDATRLCTGCDNAGGTPIDIPEYYYDASNPPLSAWDFDDIWEGSGSDYPTLRSNAL